jgi:inorganic pyrophosphatase
MAEDFIEIIVEVPKGSRNKYEFDHERHRIVLDRRLFSATTYPADYGFIPDTLARDEDPLDALVLLDDATFPGCVVHGRPVGVLEMEDEKGPDEKIICVPIFDPVYAEVNDLESLHHPLLNEIEHFFDVYKMLEPNKKTTMIGYKGRDQAWNVIEDARKRYRENR